MMPDWAGGAVLARGEYEYRCNDHVAPLSETWQVAQMSNGYEISSTRTVPSQSLVIRARAQVVSGSIARCWLRWCVQGGEECLATATYRGDRKRKAGGLYRFRRAGFPVRSVPVKEQHYFPLLRVFSGQLLGALAAEGGRGEVLVPWIQDPARSDRLFTPDFSLRTLEHLGVERRGDGGGRVDCYRYGGGQYENSAEYRLRDGLLLDYRWQQGEKIWHVLLKNVCGQWPGEKLWPHARPKPALTSAVHEGVGEEVVR